MGKKRRVLSNPKFKHLRNHPKYRGLFKKETPIAASPTEPELKEALKEEVVTPVLESPQPETTPKIKKTPPASLRKETKTKVSSKKTSTKKQSTRKSPKTTLKK